MSQFIIQSAAATMPISCKGGPYRRVAVLEVEDGVERVKMISGRARGVVRVVRTWERRFVGLTDKSAFFRAKAEAEALVAELTAQVQP